MDKLIYTCDAPLCLIDLSGGFIYIVIEHDFIQYMSEINPPKCPLCNGNLRLIEQVEEKEVMEESSANIS